MSRKLRYSVTMERFFRQGCAVLLIATVSGGKTMKDEKTSQYHVHRAEKSIGEFVAEDYRTAAVFEKYGIDFCCGKVTCASAQVPPSIG